MINKSRVYPTGCFPDEQDNRDILLEAVMEDTSIPSWKKGYNVEDEVRKKWKVVTHVPHQKFGSCVSEATSNYLEYLEIYENHKFINLGARFLHTWIKERDGVASQGTWIRWGMKAATKVGTCERSLLPEPEQKPMSWGQFIDKSKIPAKAFKNALIYKSKSYARAEHNNNLDLVRQCIFQNHGMVSGAEGDNTGWFNGETRRMGIPKVPTEKRWGHALLFIGWKLIDGKKYIIFKNSWGGGKNGWGDKGYGYLSEEYFQKGKVFAMWSLVDLPNKYLVNTKMIRLIREKGRNEVFAVISGKNYYIGNPQTFENFKAELKDGKKWPEWKDVNPVDYPISIDGIIK